MCFSFNEKWINQLAFCVHIQLCLLCGAIDLSTSMGVFFFSFSLFPSSMKLYLRMVFLHSFPPLFWYVIYLISLSSKIVLQQSTARKKKYSSNRVIKHKSRSFTRYIQSSKVDISTILIETKIIISIQCSQLLLLVIGYCGFVDGTQTKYSTFSCNVMLCILAM